MCTHETRTVPSQSFLRAKDSQEIVGEYTIRVCVECCNVVGTVTSGGFDSASATFECDGNDIAGAARTALDAARVGG